MAPGNCRGAKSEALWPVVGLSASRRRRMWFKPTTGINILGFRGSGFIDIWEGQRVTGKRAKKWPKFAMDKIFKILGLLFGQKSASSS